MLSSWIKMQIYLLKYWLDCIVKSGFLNSIETWYKYKRVLVMKIWIKMLLSQGLKWHAQELQQDPELRYSTFLLDLLMILKRRPMSSKIVLDVLLQVDFPCSTSADLISYTWDVSDKRHLQNHITYILHYNLGVFNIQFHWHSYRSY